MTVEKLMTVNEVAEELRIGRKKVVLLIKEGSIKAMDIGRKGSHIYRIEQKWLREYLDSTQL